MREARELIKLLKQGGDVMRRAVGYLDPDVNQMMHPLVLDLAADGVPVTMTSRVLGFSPKRSIDSASIPTPTNWDDAHRSTPPAIHADDPAF